MTSKSADTPSEEPAPDTPGDAAGADAAQPAALTTAMHHDALFRYVFSNPVHASAVLQVLLPPEVARHIDWDNLEPVHASMVGDAGKQFHGDLVFKALLDDGRLAFLWFLFEHQSSIDYWMIWRMTGMTFHFLRGWRRKHPKARYLPAVLPVVLHHGPRPWTAPTSLLEVTDLTDQTRADLAGHLLSFRFVLHDLRTVPDEALDTPLLEPLPRLALGNMKHHKSEELPEFYLTHIGDVRQLLTSEQGRRDLFFLLDYTDNVHPSLDRATLVRLLAPLVGPELKPIMLTYDQLVELKAERKVEQKVIERVSKQISEKAFQQGLERGLEKGLERGLEKGLERALENQRAQMLRLLTRRFGALPDAVAARVADAGAEDLDRWFDQILDVASPDELFAEPEPAR